MNKKIILIVLSILVSPVCVQADKISVQEERRFNWEVFRMLDAYEGHAKLFDAEDKRHFIDLFSSEAILYNDLLGLSEKDTLNIAEYVELMSGQTQPMSQSVVIKNVRKGKIQDGGTVWLLDVMFDKYIRYQTSDKIMIDSKDYYDADYALKARFAYDKINHECKIVSIEGSIESNRPALSTSFLVVQKQEKNAGREEKVKYMSNDGNQLFPAKFNAFGQLLLPTDMKVRYPDPDVKVSLESLGGRLHQINFKGTHFRIKPRFETTLDKAFDVDKSDLVRAHSRENVVGLDLGYVPSARGFFKFGIFTGAALSLSELNLSLADEFNYYYNADADADIDGDNYERHYHIKSMQQGVKNMDLMLPVYFDFDFVCSKYISVYFDLGAKLYMNLSHEMTNFADVDVYGRYPQYGNLEIREWPYNGFGSHTIGTNTLISMAYEKYSMDLFGGAGIRVRLAGPLYLGIGAQYQMGMKELLSSGQRIEFGNQFYTSFRAPITYTVLGGEKVKPLMSTMSRQSVKLNLELIIKL